MRKYAFVLSILAIVGVVFILSISNRGEVQDQTTNPSTLNEKPQEVNFTATFEIYTLGTKRIFTSEMYHNRSEDVFIQNPNPSIINVRKAGITWDDFFITLPFKLTGECLVTGTGQTFCNNETQRLHFLLNDIEVPNALDLEIRPEDSLVVEYY